DGTAYSFVPEGSWVEIPSSDSLNPGTRDFSFSAWIKVSQAPTADQTYDAVRKGLTTTKTGDFKFEMSKGGKVRCIAKDSARHAASVYGPVRNYADGSWHYFTCARTGSSWSITIDGITRSKLGSLGSISNGSALSIGSKYGDQDDVVGLLDEVQFTIG
ncbi:MAG: LamG-like jellyroll fold domain-containing protein, partial [Nocardioidaceae bacterium]